MAGAFRFIALPIERVESILTLSDEELRARGGVRLVVDRKPGYPCRVSLVDGEVGERVVLIPFTHHDVASPYRASGPIFIREGARTSHPNVNEVPAMFRSRLLSVRAYDANALMVGAEVVDGMALEDPVARFFDDPRVEYLHVHNARPGCFNCRVERA